MDPTGRGFVLSRQAECCWGVEAPLDYAGLQRGSSSEECDKPFVLSCGVLLTQAWARPWAWGQQPQRLWRPLWRPFQRVRHKSSSSHLCHYLLPGQSDISTCFLPCLCCAPSCLRCALLTTMQHASRSLYYACLRSQVLRLERTSSRRPGCGGAAGCTTSSNQCHPWHQ